MTVKRAFTVHLTIKMEHFTVKSTINSNRAKCANIFTFPQALEAEHASEVNGTIL